MKTINGGVEEFDGLTVVQYEGKFSGAFDIPDDTAIELSYDDVVTFVVTARVGKAVLDATKFGDMKRSNTFNVVHVAVLDGNVSDSFYKILEEGGDNV